MNRIRATGLFVCLWASLTLAASARSVTVDHFATAALVTLFWAMVQGAGLWYARSHDAPPDKKVIDAIAAFGLCVFMLELILNGIAQGLMSLLLFLQAARNPALATRRDAYFALAISLTLIVFGASAARSSWFLLVMVAFGLSALGVLVYCHQQGGFEHEALAWHGQDGVGAPPPWSLSLRHLAALGGAVFMLSLFWYLLVPRPTALNLGAVSGSAGDKYANKKWEADARRALAKSDAADDATAAMADALDAALRRATNNAQDRPGRADGQASAGEGEGAGGQSAPPAKELGINDTLDITHNGNRQHAKPGQRPKPGKDDNGIVLFVQAPRALYLREQSFDHFQGKRWSATSRETIKLLPKQDRFDLSKTPAEAGDKVQYRVEVLANIGDILPLSAHAQTLQAPADVIAQAADATVYLPARIEAGFHYGATALLPRNLERAVVFDPAGAAVAPAAPPTAEGATPADPADPATPAPEAPSAYAATLQLPTDDSPRIGDLARKVSAGAGTPFDKALALETHLRTSYAYSFNPVAAPESATPLEDFLFVTRRGHCEYFASAMALMLREIGIPSRLVQGYLANSFNPVIGMYEVRRLDHHAWVEAHIDGIGWVTFEPTAAYPVPQRQQQSGTTLKDLKDYAETLERQDKLQGEQGLLQIVTSLLRVTTEGWYLLLFLLQNWLDALRAWMQGHAGVIGLTLALLALAAAAGYRQRVLLSWQWARFRLRATPAADVPLCALRQLERVARLKQLGRKDSETADDYLNRLELGHADLRVPLRVLRRAFNARRYDGRKLNADETRTVQQAFETVGAGLMMGKS